MKALSKNVIVNLTWHSNPDACHKCLSLNNQQFLDVDIFQSILYHPVYGAVWNLDMNQSLAHPHCKCTLEINFEFPLVELKEEWSEVKI